MMAQIRNAISYEGELFNIMFYGPAGTGKTMLARNIFQQLAVEYPDQFLYFMTSGAKLAALAERKDGSAVVEIQKMGKIAREAAAKDKFALFFMDEADAIMARRGSNTSPEVERALTEFLTQFDRPSHPHIMFIINTNRPEVLDSAIAGESGARFSRANWLEIGVPDIEQREQMLNQYLEIASGRLTKPVAITISNMNQYAQALEGAVGRDIEELANLMVREAASAQERTVSDATASQIISEFKHAAEKQREYAATSAWSSGDTNSREKGTTSVAQLRKMNALGTMLQKVAMRIGHI
jgi:ATP-dependent 26S proteasome regulatory subunit